MLAVRSFEVSPLFDGRSLVYRNGIESYEQDPYAAFMVPPRAALQIPVRAWLRNSGSFRDVVESGSLIQADRLVEVQVSDLYGDLRDRSHPAAVLAMRFTFFRINAGSPPVVYLRKTYLRRVDISTNSAARVVAGWNQALTEIMTEVNSDLAVASAR